MSEGARYDTIGTGYDAVRSADPGLVRGFLDYLKLPAGGRLLDLACGSGNYTAAFARSDVDVTGLDRSALMLTAARTKTGVPLLQGDATRLPFTDAAFDAVSCCLAIHHFPEIAAPFREVFRVLKRGRFVLFTSTPEQMDGYWLHEYFPTMVRRASDVMPDFDRTKSALEAAGFRVQPYVPWWVPDDLQDHFMYSGKRHPQFYLDERYRAGSSGFRLYSQPAELANGLVRLEADIASGRIDEVIRAYDNETGDYGWVVAEKA